ncbi:alpha-amylase family glycosyl hydrolase [Phaeovulum sp.]|uniref:alpha-amylase family glycosyl hydrolase n=1 Tax=Phaeovulum sp. TaxID=2934796 RepID=UPI003561AC78
MAEWWRGAVVYQIYPRSFQDSNGDGVGDLAGITARLEHVAQLGADAIWLSPVFRSPMADMGYDVSDYCDIDPLFGTLADFDALVARAHALGLKVILDQVLSHSSDAHPWFADSRVRGDKADWYVWADAKPDGSPPNNWISVFGGSAWEWDAGRRQYYLHNFLARQPDLNLHNPEVQAAVEDVLRFWLARGVDGFRLDTVNYYLHDPALRDNPPAPLAPDGLPPSNTYDMQDHRFDKSRPENLALLRRLRAVCDSFPGTCLLGEVGEVEGRALPIMAEYTRPGRLHMAYSFDLLGDSYTPAHFRAVIEGFFAAAPDGWPYWSFSNHDVMRPVSRWAAYGASPAALARQALALLASLPGTIGLYQGEEFGLPETELDYDELTDPVGLRFWPEIKGRDGCRAPMVWNAGAGAGFSTARPWLPIKPPQAALNLAAQAATPDSVWHHARAMLTLRRASLPLRIGTVRFLDLPAPLLGMVRSYGDTEISSVFNLSASDVPLLQAPRGKMSALSEGVERRDQALVLAANSFAWFNFDLS